MTSADEWMAMNEQKRAFVDMREWATMAGVNASSWSLSREREHCHVVAADSEIFATFGKSDEAVVEGLRAMSYAFRAVALART